MSILLRTRADSLEDTWPRWITGQFKGPRPSEVRAERGGIKLKPWSTLQPELIIRCVCRACNNGWMSQLETKVQSFLQPLLAGQSGTVDIRSQEVIALWAVKTAMVLEGLDPTEKRMYRQEQRERLRSSAEVPWRTSIWLAASAVPEWFMSIRTGISAWRRKVSLVHQRQWLWARRVAGVDDKGS